jgi:hypothetical protein
MPSVLSEIPGELELVIVLTPADAAPYTMLIAAISDSACKNVPPTFGSFFAKYAATSVCGVIGYPKKHLQPARIAASANASLPFINDFSKNFSPYFSTVMQTSGHIVPHIAHPMQLSGFTNSAVKYPLLLRCDFDSSIQALGQAFTHNAQPLHLPVLIVILGIFRLSFRRLFSIITQLKAVLKY